VWLPADGKPIKGCRGFAIRRIHNGQEDYLHGFVGFSDDDKLDPQNPWKFPLQRYLWWDYLVKPGDTVQYSVVPVVGAAAAHLARGAAGASPRGEARAMTGQGAPHVSAYFNKGVVAAQWGSRALAQEAQNNPKAKIKGLVAKAGDPLREALAGLLKPQ